MSTVERRLYRVMWDRAEKHVPACEKAAFPLPMISIMVAMNLEQEKELYWLRERLKAQDKEIGRLQAENLFLRGEIKTLQGEFEKRLRRFREEMLAIKYPEDMAIRHAD